MPDAEDARSSATPGPLVAPDRHLVALGTGEAREGRLKGLEVVSPPGAEIRYGLALGDAVVDLNGLLDSGVELKIEGAPTCLSCGTRLLKRPGHGHCYDCFISKASLDLCYVAPSRCHFANGTCREPDWGESVCMQPHAVYLANSGGLKVGLTRHADGVARWIEQGATAGVVLARAPTRRLAGILEERIGALVSDKTDWRRQVTGGSPSIDLALEAERIRASVDLPDGCRWEIAAPKVIRYPIVRHLRRVVRLKYPASSVFRGRLTGVIGSFLLLDHGAFHVGEHRGYPLRLTSVGPLDDLQGELF